MTNLNCRYWKLEVPLGWLKCHIRECNAWMEWVALKRSRGLWRNWTSMRWESWHHGHMPQHTKTKLSTLKCKSQMAKPITWKCQQQTSKFQTHNLEISNIDSWKRPESFHHWHMTRKWSSTMCSSWFGCETYFSTETWMLKFEKQNPWPAAPLRKNDCQFWVQHNLKFVKFQASTMLDAHACIDQQKAFFQHPHEFCHWFVEHKMATAFPTVKLLVCVDANFVPIFLFQPLKIRNLTRKASRFFNCKTQLPMFVPQFEKWHLPWHRSVFVFSPNFFSVGSLGDDGFLTSSSSVIDGDVTQDHTPHDASSSIHRRDRGRNATPPVSMGFGVLDFFGGWIVVSSFVCTDWSTIPNVREKGSERFTTVVGCHQEQSKHTAWTCFRDHDCVSSFSVWFFSAAVLIILYRVSVSLCLHQFQLFA